MKNSALFKLSAGLILGALTVIACSTNDNLAKYNDSKLSNPDAMKLMNMIEESQDPGEIKNWIMVINNTELSKARRFAAVVGFTQKHINGGDLGTLLQYPTIREWFEKSRIANSFAKLPAEVNADRKNTILVLTPKPMVGEHALYIQLDQKLTWDQIFKTQPKACRIRTVVWYPKIQMEKMMK